MSRAVIYALGLLLGVGTSLYANPRDEVLRLVPGESSFCFLVQNLRQHSEQLRDSPFVGHVAKLPLGTKLTGAPELAQLEAINGFMRDQVGIGVEEMRDDIFGDAFAIVYQNPPSDQPDKEKSLILVWVRKPDLLKKVIQKADLLEGVTNTKDIEHAGRTYRQRTKADGKDFFFILGNVFGFSDREDVVREALERDRDLPAVATKPPVMTQRLRDLGIVDELMLLYLNPRSFDTELRERQMKAKNGDRAFLDTFVRYWDALDGIAIYLSMERELAIGVSVRMRTDALSANAKRFFAGLGTPSAVAPSIPADAIIALGGRLDGMALAEMLGEFLTPESRAKLHAVIDENVSPILGRDLPIDKVFAAMGPDWAMWLAPRPESKEWFPELLLAVKLQGDEAEKQWLQALEQLAFLLRFNYNRTHPAGDQIRIVDVKQDGVMVKCIVNDKTFPVGFQPGFALKNGYLLIASSPESIGRFRVTAPGVNPDEIAMVRLSLTSLRKYVGVHRAGVEKFLADTNQTTPAAIRDKLDAFLSVMELFDRVELVQQSGNQFATLKVRCRMVEPLKKDK